MTTLPLHSLPNVNLKTYNRTWNATSGDRKVRRDMVLGWERFTKGGFECVEIQGNHLFPLDKEPKTVWLQHIADRLSTHNLR